MNLSRQIALVACPPVLFLLLQAFLGAVIDWNSAPLHIAATFLMAAMSVGLSYIFAKPILAKVAAMSKMAQSLMLDEDGNAVEAVADGNASEAIFKGLKFAKQNQEKLENTLRENATAITGFEDTRHESLFKSSAFEGSSVAMMMVDRDFMVTFVNEATRKLLTDKEQEFRAIWPTFRADSIIGACIDMFHKNPAHQRQLLSNPANLPFKTDIEVGDARFSLNVSGIFNEAGDFVGCTLEWADVAAIRLNSGMLNALDKSQATIEFKPDGTIVAANENFLGAVGYSLDEIKGQNHSMFVEPEYSASADYRAFWDSLRRGEFQSAEYKRIGKGGKEIWIQATYNPILDDNGKTFKVVKFAADITELVRTRREALFKSSAFEGSSVAMMMVDRDFMVTYVNGSTKKLLADKEEEFRAVWPSFRADSVVGACIDMFHKNPDHQRQLLSNPANLPFNTDIAIGDARFSLNVNGVFDVAGEYVGCTLEWADVTAIRLNAGMLNALDKSQATIEFMPDGTIVNANQNFLSVMGYTLNEIKGQHHRLFVESAISDGQDYRAFWDKLNNGEAQSDEFKRVAKGGKIVHIQATYNPVFDGNGNVFKVVKFASDVTSVVEERQRNNEERAKREQTQEKVVSSLAAGLDKLSHGDLISRLDEEFAPEYEGLRTNFNSAVTQLQTTMSTIVTTAEGIQHGSSEISSATDDLSKRTENQAATLEQTAAALDEITATVKQSADNAAEANSEASSAQEEAQQSGEVVQETVSAMGEIEKSSTQISQIIGVIDDIAFQTNLLALNAGVEAARAGDAGRGFAVVAQEVRALAQRSSDAAKEIKTLITESSRHVETGVDLVDRAGEALQKIVKRVEVVNGLVSEIAASASEQADSLSEANSAVNNMDQVTQQNASMVEETTAASHSLSNDAGELMRQVSSFDIGGNTNATPSKSASRAGSGGRESKEDNVLEQQGRVASFAMANGSAALKNGDGTNNTEWQDF